MTGVRPDAVAEAFGFPPPIGALESMPQRGFKQIWHMDTGAGPMLVKQFWPYDELPHFRDRFERAMEFERLAVRAGIDTPAPVTPAQPVFGTVARIHGHGLFRAFPYLQHRPLADDDDIAEWLGTTLAHIHRLHQLDRRPEPHWSYAQRPPVPQAQWLSWLENGERTGMSWARALRNHLEFVLDQASRVVETFNTSPPYVVSHNDVGPGNILMTDDGPVLIDWDDAGPESAPLEAAYVFLTIARRGRDKPDPESIRQAHAAYVAAGGKPLVAREGTLDRVIGQHLATITTPLRGYFAGGHSEEQIRARIEGLPAVVAKVRAWERILANATSG